MCFLTIADELQLKGLMGKVNVDEEIPTKVELPSLENKIRNNKPSTSNASAALENNFNEKFSNTGQKERAVVLTSHFLGNCGSLMISATQ